MDFFTLLSIDYLLGMGAWLAGLWGLLVILMRWRRSRRRAGRSLRDPHIALACWMLAAALTMPELACALFYDATDSFSQTNVSQRWFQRHVRVNRAGYRDDRELPTRRESGKTYLAFTGDSFTFGHGVRRPADRFSDRIDAALADQHVVTYNVGLPGMDIRQLTDGMLTELEQQRTPLDLLVYTFVPNDIEYCDERTAAFYQQQAVRSPQWFPWKQTYFYNLLYYRVPAIGGSGSDYYGYLAESYQGQPWDRFAGKLDQLATWCRGRNVTLLVTVFPFLPTLGEQDPFLPAYAKVVEHCRERQVDCVDLTPTLTAHRTAGLAVSRFDAHPNERAHQLAAETLLPELRRLLQLRQAKVTRADRVVLSDGLTESGKSN